MRRIILKGMLLLAALSWYPTGKVFASPPSNEITTFNWNPLIGAIAMVESTNNPNAIGKGGSVGLLQITPILVKDCNNILKSKKKSKQYTLQDRLNPEKSKEMFILIQEKYNPECNIEKAIRLWNGGPNFSVKKTQNYLNKVKHYLS